MRNMSFVLKTQQIYDGTADVTRRIGWWFLKYGDLVMAVEKGMGLKKGEKVVKIRPIRIISAQPEMLRLITQREVEREGFPDKTPEWFIDFFCKTHKGCTPETKVNRIEFGYYG